MTAQEPINALALEQYQRVMTHEGMEPNHLLGKSALYRRLCEGKAPLAVPPPLSHSYPWYDAVEASAALEIMEPAELLAEEDFLGRAGLIIHQCLWILLDSTTANTYRVTYPGWDKLGFTWRVWLARVPAEQSGSQLCCYHNPAVARITTPEQVEAECRYKVQQECDRLQWADKLPLEAAAKAIAAEAAGRNPSLNRCSVHRAASLYQAERYLKRLVERRASGKPALPDADEIEAMVAAEREKLLSREWEIADGTLWRWNWFLQREAPAQLGPEHYLSI